MILLIFLYLNYAHHIELVKECMRYLNTALQSAQHIVGRHTLSDYCMSPSQLKVLSQWLIV